MKKIGTFILLCGAIAAAGQERIQGRQQDAASGKIFTMVEQMPEFPGGRPVLQKYLEQYTGYPAVARTCHITGSVWIRIVVTADGSIRNAEVVRGIGSGCDEEALRVVRHMPRWTPGRQNGQPVAVYYTLPVSFPPASGDIKR